MSQTPTQPRSSTTGTGTSGTRGTVHTIHYHLSFIQQGDLTDHTQPVVVFLHGFPGDATKWDSVLPAVTSHPALAFDLLGYGQSDRPWPADTSVWGHGDSLNLALRALDLQRIILVGYGLGGGVAQVLATRLIPELVKGLVLIDSIGYQYSFHPNWPLSDMAKSQDPELPFHTKPEDLIAQLRETLPQASANPSSISGALLDSYLKPWSDDLGKEVFYEQVRRLVPYYLNAVAADLPQIACPTLLVWGEHDTIVPLKIGQRLQRNIPGSRLEVVPGVGHLILDDAPARVAQLVADFVAKI